MLLSGGPLRGMTFELRSQGQASHVRSRVGASQAEGTVPAKIQRLRESLRLPVWLESRVQGGRKLGGEVSKEDRKT